MPTKKYPTKADKDGFYFLSKMDEDQGIFTKDPEKGNRIKKVILSTGQEAVIRKLRGRDMVETKKRILADNSLDFETANMAVAIKIDGKQQPPEFYLDELFQNDYSVLMIAYSSLNFQ